jgi:hypothetical protein
MTAARTYCFEVQGRLSESIESSFPGMSLHRDNGTITLVGVVRDQAELHGLLRRCLDLDLTLLSMTSTGEALAG